MKIIGAITRLVNFEEHPYLRGYDVKIIAVLKDALVKDEHEYLTTDADIYRAGGVTARDRVDVAPIMDGGRASFASSDVRAIDIELFSRLQHTDKPIQ